MSGKPLMSYSCVRYTMPKAKPRNSTYTEYHRKPNAGLRLSLENIERLKLLSEYYSVGKADVVEMLIRDRCRQEGIDL